MTSLDANFDIIFNDVMKETTKINGFNSDYNTLGLLCITPHKNSIGILEGKCGTGKTTLLSIIAAEWVLNGKSVLYLTDDRVKVILDKVSKIIPLNNKTDRNLSVSSSSSLKENIDDYLRILFSEETFDIVIVDSYTTNKIDFLELSRKYNTFFLVSEQSKLKLIMELSSDIRKQQAADFIISISKTKPKQLAWYIRLFDYLCFWKPKRLQPNSTLKIIKNRYGKSGIHYDFLMNPETMKLVPTNKPK